MDDSKEDGAQKSDSPFAWLVQDLESSTAGAKSVSTRWKPLRRRDSIRLEEAIHNQEAGPIPVEMGRYDVDLKKRTMRPVFWDEPERRVLRSSWFYGKGHERQPYEEEDAENLEKAYHDLFAGRARLPHLVPVNRAIHDVRFEAIPDDAGGGWWGNSSSSDKRPSVAGERVQGSTLQNFSAVQEPVNREHGETSRPVWRGFDSEPGGSVNIEEDDEEELLPSRVECLVFVVHGIGQARGHISQYSGLHKDVNRVRKLAVAYLRNKMKAGGHVPGRIEFLPLEWYEQIHLEVGIGNRLKQVTLPSVPALRDFANYAVVDILVYQDAAWKSQIHSLLQKKMARLFNLFIARTPDYSQEISVMAHSLGAVIMFDLVQRVITELKEGLLLGPSPNTQEPSMEPGGNSRRLTTPALQRAALAAVAAASQKFDPPSRSDVQEEKDEMESQRRQPVLGPVLEDEALDATEGGSVGVSSSNEPAVDVFVPMPRCFFAFGSPLGMFLTLGSSRLRAKRTSTLKYFQGLDVRWPAASMGRGWRFFNIFHPDDPIAYRIEPILNPNYADVPPRIVPHLGGLRWNNQVRELWGSISSRIPYIGAPPVDEGTSDKAVADVLLVHTEQASTAPGTSFWDDGSARRDIAAVDRIDYALQESAFESMNEFVSAINSHYTYWDSEDMIHFLVDQTLEALDNKVTFRPAPGMAG